MPISHKHKLIFIHIPKCAGISMWHSLGLTATKPNLISVTAPVLQHLLPKQLKGKYIDKKTWDSYKKFTIIRDPYERVVSDFFWMKEYASHVITGSFDDFLTLREDIVLNNKYHLDLFYDHFYPMHFYFEGIKYDHVLRFENLEEEFEKIRKLYKIKNPLTKNNQSSSNGYELSDDQKERIYALYEKDFKKFGYKKHITNLKTNNLSAADKKIIDEKNQLINKLESTLKNTQDNVFAPLNEMMVQLTKVIRNNNLLETTPKLKVIVTGMEHSGTTFLSQLITVNSSLINSGFECGILLSESPRKFYEVEPFYEWLCREDLGWALTEEQRKYICETDTYDEFYSRLIKTSSLFKAGEPYVLDKTPAYCYYLSGIINKMPGVPILIIMKDIELMWHSYLNRNLSFEYFVENFLKFKASLLEVLPHKQIKIIKLEDIESYNLEKIKDIFSFINLPLENIKKIQDFKWDGISADFNLAKAKKEATAAISEEHKIALKEINFKAAELLNEENNFIQLENERSLLSVQLKNLEETLSNEKSNYLTNIQSLNDLNQALIQDKTQLTSEISLKNDQLNKVFIEKEKLEQTLSQRDNKIIQASEKAATEKGNLEKKLNEKNDEIVELSKKALVEKTNLEKKLAEKESAINEITNSSSVEIETLKKMLLEKESSLAEISRKSSGDIAALEKKLAEKEKTIVDLNQKTSSEKESLEKRFAEKETALDKIAGKLLQEEKTVIEKDGSIKILEADLSNKKKHIIQLEDDKRQLYNTLSESNNTAQQLLLKIENLERTIIELNAKINDYQERYENNSLLKIMTNRILKK